MPLSLTLKQKLSNLALSQSVPATPTSSSTYSSSARRNILTFARRGDKTGDEPGYDYSNSAIEEEALDNIMQGIVRQSGLDYECVLQSFIVCQLQLAKRLRLVIGRDQCLFLSHPGA